MIEHQVDCCFNAMPMVSLFISLAHCVCFYISPTAFKGERVVGFGIACCMLRVLIELVNCCFDVKLALLKLVGLLVFLNDVAACCKFSM